MINKLRKDIIIYANRASSSAATLGRSLVCRRWLVERERLAGRAINPDRLVVNWGTTEQPRWFNPHGIVLNGFEAVARSISKIQSHKAFAAAGVPTLELTTSIDEARRWGGEGRSVLARRDGLAGGRGVTILEGSAVADFQGNADFFTRYFPKTHEYRVHVFRCKTGMPVSNQRERADDVSASQRASALGAAPASTPGDGAGTPASVLHGTDEVQQGGTSERDSAKERELDSFRVIDITQKKKAVRGGHDGSGLDDGEARTAYQRIVRSHANGWVHAHEDLHLPDEARKTIEDAAIAAVAALNLDFGAVDVLARFSRKHPMRLRGLAVCEVNTAPGLENQATIEAYKHAIEEYASSIHEQPVSV